MRSTRLFSIFLGMGSAAVSSAQSNAFGIVQLGLSADLGFYATTYEQEILGQDYSDEDGAASWSVPFEVHVGLIQPLSLGLYLQPGSYLDSSATRSNSFFIGGLAPRVYIVNKDRFNWWGGLEAGLATLVIDDIDSFGNDFQYTFSGGHFRLCSGINYYFGGLVGMQFNMKFAGYNLPLRDIEPDVGDFDSLLKVKGMELGLGLMFKLGGS